MLGVIMIHVSSGYVYLPSSVSLLGGNLAFFLNQFSRFSVPLFLILSGAALSRSRPPAGKDVLRFYGRRGRKLLLPYVVWSAFYCMFVQNWTLNELLGLPFLRTLLLGQAAPHLYFVVVLAQCYLVYPLLCRWMERSACACLVTLFTLTFWAQNLIEFRAFGLELIPWTLPSRHFWLMLPAWIFYFAAGMVLTPCRMAALRRLTAGAPLSFFSAGAALAMLSAVEGLAAGQMESSLRPLLLPYQFLVLPALLAAWGGICRVTWIRRAVGFLARHSMTIYFCHVFFLVCFQGREVFSGTRGFLLLYLAVLAAAAAGAFLLDTGETICKTVGKRARRDK